MIDLDAITSPGERPVRVDMGNVEAGYLRSVAATLYDLGATQPLPAAVDVPDSLVPYVRHVVAALGGSTAVNGTGPVPPEAVVPLADDRVLVLPFSGGKDSTATALLAQRAGYQVVLYYMAGVNPSYPDERRYAEGIAALLGLPLVERSARIVGQRSGYWEPQTKNQVLVACAAAWAQAAGTGGTFTLGLFRGGDRSAPMTEVSDTEAACLAFVPFVEEAAPGFRWHRPWLRESVDSLAVVASEGGALLDAVHGCFAPPRFRGTWAAQAGRRLGIAVLPGRCGLHCPKCAAEYLVLRGLGVLDDGQGNAAADEAALAYLVRRTAEIYPHLVPPGGLSAEATRALYVRDDLIAEWRDTWAAGGTVPAGIDG